MKHESHTPQPDEPRDLDVDETDAEGVTGGMQESQKMQEMNMSLQPPAPTAHP